MTRVPQLSGRTHIFVTRVPQLSGRRHIFVTVAAVSLLRFSPCAFVCPRISCFLGDPGVFVTRFHAPISMACHDTLPYDPSFLLEYLEQLPYESDSDGNEFEGYLGPDDGPVVIRAIDSAGYEDQEPESPPYRSRSLDSLTVIGQECESPLPSISPSLSPMHLGSPAAAYSPTQSPTPVAGSAHTAQASYILAQLKLF